jgi:hypothetical protein
MVRVRVGSAKLWGGWGGAHRRPHLRGEREERGPWPMGYHDGPCPCPCAMSHVACGPWRCWLTVLQVCGNCCRLHRLQHRKAQVHVFLWLGLLALLADAAVPVPERRSRSRSAVPLR